MTLLRVCADAIPPFWAGVMPPRITVPEFRMVAEDQLRVSASHIACAYDSPPLPKSQFLPKKIALGRSGLACRRQFSFEKSKESHKMLRFITKKGNLGGLDQGGRSESCGIL